MEKQLRIEEEARRRMEISAANGIREKQMKRRNKYTTRSTAAKKIVVPDSVSKKTKRKKKRQIRSAGERGISSHHTSKTFSEDGDNVYTDEVDSGSDGDNFGLNKGKDVDLLPKRRKKESMRAYLLRATRVFEKVEKNVGRRNRTEPVLAFVERARKALLSEGVVGVNDVERQQVPTARPPHHSVGDGGNDSTYLEADATMLI